MIIFWMIFNKEWYDVLATIISIDLVHSSRDSSVKCGIFSLRFTLFDLIYLHRPSYPSAFVNYRMQSDDTHM